LHNPWLDQGSGMANFDPSDTRSLLRYLNTVIPNPHDLKQKAKMVFERMAQPGGLDVNGLLQYKNFMEGQRHIPCLPVDNYNDAFDRFDFNGNGKLDFHECWKLIRELLHELRIEIGGEPEVNVPWKTPEQAGYTIIKVLASGGQGSANLARDSTGMEVVVKTYSKACANAGGLEALKEEMHAMTTVGGHPGIAHCFEIFQDRENLYMSSNLNKGGDLASLREKAMAEGINMTEIWWKRIFHQSFSALEYMHKKAVMHCDIKEPNLMIKEARHDAPEVIIIDLGMAGAMSGKDKGICGTPGYIPPEVYAEGKWFPQGDVFSMGVVMVQLMTNKVPNEKTGKMGVFQEGCMTMEDLQTVIQSREAPLHLMEVQHPHFVSVVQQCLIKDRRTRAKAPMVLQSPWFLQ